MAIALDANLGTNQLTASGTSITLTTAAAAAAGSRVILMIGYFSGGTVTSVSGGGLTWVEDMESTAASPGLAVYSADAPSGLAVSTVLTVTFDAAVSGRKVTGASFTGLAGGSSGYLSGTPPATDTASGGTAWATPSHTPADADALLISLVFLDIFVACTATVTSPALELHDLQQGTASMMVTGYRIVSSIASYSIAGTFSAAGNTHRHGIVAYKAAGAGGGGSAEVGFNRRRRQRRRF